MKYSQHPYWTGYKASKNGSVTGKRGKLLSPIKHHTGYLVITVRKDGKQKQVRLHRLVWECHYGIIEDADLVINHLDGDKHNNSLDNLELVTQSENCIHAFENNLRTAIKGDNVRTSKLSNEDAERVIRLCISGEANGRIGVEFGIHPNYVSLIRHRKRWGWLWDNLGL